MISRGQFSLILADPKHLPFIVKWKNESGFSWRPTSIKVEAERLSQRSVGAMVCLNAGVPIGFSETKAINTTARVKEARIFSEAKDDLQAIIGMVSDLEFLVAGTHKLVAHVLATDGPKIRAYEGCGFKQEVRERQHWFKDGSFVAAIKLGLLRENYERSKDHAAAD